jgi:hypothetical protein
VATAGGTVFVLDLAGSVQRFDPNGTVLGRWGSGWGGLGLGPNGIATDGAGSVYAVDDQQRILKFSCP